MFRFGIRGTFASFLLPMVISVAGDLSRDFSQSRVTPENLTDINGNFADVHSRISWAPTPMGKPYIETTVSSEDGHVLLEVLYVVAERFVGVVMAQTMQEGKYPF